MTNCVHNLVFIETLDKHKISTAKEKIDNAMISFYDKKINDNIHYYLTRGLNKDELIDASYENGLKFSVLSYDIGIGYACKASLDNGWLTSIRNAPFGIDYEIYLMDKSEKENKPFHCVLDEYITSNSKEQSSVVKIGDKIKINELLCQDNELLDWYDNQANKELEVVSLDFATCGVWVKDCDYRIDMSEILR